MTKPNYQADDFFVMRTPALPRCRYDRWTEQGLSAQTIDQELENLRLALKAQLEDPGVREAIYLASPSLFERLRYWHKDPGSEKGQKAEDAVTRYFTRMTHRPTPFGLFAAVSLGKIGDQTALKADPPAEDRRHSRLDMHFLQELLDEQLSKPEIKNGLRYQPNGTVRSCVDKRHFIERYN